MLMSAGAQNGLSGSENTGRQRERPKAIAALLPPARARFKQQQRSWFRYRAKGTIIAQTYIDNTLQTSLWPVRVATAVPICMGDSFGLRKMVLPTVLGNGRHLLEARLNKRNLRLVTRAEILKEWNAIIVVDNMPQLVQRVLAAEGGRC